MTDTQADEPDETDSPATWENVVVGKAKEVVGKALGDEELVAEGEAQEQIAHEVRVHRDNEQLE